MKSQVIFKFLLIIKQSIPYLIALGVWIIVFQNAGFLPGAEKVRLVEKKCSVDDYAEEKYVLPVRVVNQPSSMGVYGTVDIGSTVDVNLHSINGYRNCFYNSYERHPNDYYRIPVTY